MLCLTCRLVLISTQRHRHYWWLRAAAVTYEWITDLNRETLGEITDLKTSRGGKECGGGGGRHQILCKKNPD